MKKIFIITDHAAFHLKNFIIQNFTNFSFSDKYEIVDLGIFNEEAVDYPDQAKKLESYINEETAGILLCGSGIGMSIAANRYKHIRAALCANEEYAKLARLHNDANILVLGARMMTSTAALHIVEKFFTTDFEGGRHKRRIDKL